MIRVTHKGDFKKTERFLKRAKDLEAFKILEKYAKAGVDALSSSTPVRSGKTASSWDYEVHASKNSYEIVWTNSNINKGVNIAVIIQLGHGTGTGGYVQGIDYINPAMKPVFDQIADGVWKEVTML